MKFELKQIGNLSYFCIPQLEGTGIIHGFFTKTASDLTDTKARQDFLGAFSLKGVVTMHQEHGDHIHVIGDGEQPKRGDGILLLERNVAGIIKTADCLPIILYEPLYPMAAIVHAGWRGTAKKITKKAIEEMIRNGADIKHIAALLGPAIGMCCYEIGEDVYRIYKKQGFSEGVFQKKGHSLYLSLKAANIEILHKAGVNEVSDTGLCTYCNEKLFASFRRGDKGSRQINFVSLRG